MCVCVCVNDTHTHTHSLSLSCLCDDELLIVQDAPLHVFLVLHTLPNHHHHDDAPMAPPRALPIVELIRSTRSVAEWSGE